MILLKPYDRINNLRKNRGITWTYLNENVEGAYHGRMTDLKNGKTTLSLEQLKTVARILSTSADYLLGNTDDPRPAAQREENKNPAPIRDGMTEPELELIQLFRLLPDDTKAGILAQIKAVLAQRGLLP